MVVTGVCKHIARSGNWYVRSPYQGIHPVEHIY